MSWLLMRDFCCVRRFECWPRLSIYIALVGGWIWSRERIGGCVFFCREQHVYITVSIFNIKSAILNYIIRSCQRNNSNKRANSSLYTGKTKKLIPISFRSFAASAARAFAHQVEMGFVVRAWGVKHDCTVVRLINGVSRHYYNYLFDFFREIYAFENELSKLNSVFMTIRPCIYRLLRWAKLHDIGFEAV